MSLLIMTVVDTYFKVEGKSKIGSFLAGKTFRNDREIVTELEDFMFGKILELEEKPDEDYVSQEEVFKALENNI